MRSCPDNDIDPSALGIRVSLGTNVNAPFLQVFTPEFGHSDLTKTVPG